MSRHAVITVLFAVTPLLWQPGLAMAQGSDDTSPHIVAHAAELVWREGPPSLPPGARFVVLEGNPAAEGPLTLRLQFPANYQVPPHRHPALEHITVLAGTLHIGMGERMDRSQGAALVPGSFAVIPIGEAHYAWTGPEPVTIQVHSNGPFEIIYINPGDDPRRR